MNEKNESPETYLQRSLREARWAPFVLLGLYALMRTLTSLSQIQSPGAPVTFFWGATAFIAAVAVILYPPAFRKLSRSAKFAVCLAILPAVVVHGLAAGRVTQAYEATPEGARRAAEREAEDRLADLEREKQEAEEAAIQQQREELAAVVQTKENLENCFSSWSGGIPSLQDDVKGSLHNPAAFEHVETTILGPIADSENIEMTFRAENEFGAIRTGWVRAEIDPNTCEIVSRGTLNVD